MVELARFNRRALANGVCAWRDIGKPRRALSLGMLFEHWLSLEENRQSWVSVERRHIDGLISAQHDGIAWEIDRLLLPAGADISLVQRLLSYVTAVGSEVGIQKIFLRVPADSDLIHAARAAGFLSYKNESLYVRGPDAADSGVRNVDLVTRTKTGSDDHAIFQLYSAAVPAAVRQAEAMLFAEWRQLNQRGRSGMRRREAVIEKEGRVVGWVQTDVRGLAGHLQVMVHPEFEDCLDSLLDTGMSLLADRSPVYCLAAEHESRLARLLVERGFAQEAAFCALVKQLSVRVRQPRLVPVPS